MFYYVDRNGQQQGPVPANELLSKGVTPDSYVWKAGMAEWQFAKTVAELSHLFAPSAPVPPVQPIQQPIQRPIQQAVQQPIQQPVQQPIQQPVQQPIQQPMPQSQPVQPVQQYPQQFAQQQYPQQYAQQDYQQPQGTSRNGIGDPVGSLKKCFKNYATIKGRATIGESLWMFLLSFVSSFIPVLGQIVGIVCMIPSLATGIRRMHDSGHSGWWVLVPFYSIYLLFFKSGDPLPNKYGPVPEV